MTASLLKALSLPAAQPELSCFEGPASKMKTFLYRYATVSRQRYKSSNTQPAAVTLVLLTDSSFDI